MGSCITILVVELPYSLQMLHFKFWPTFMMVCSLLYFSVCLLVAENPADSYHKLNIRDHAGEMWLLPLTNARLTLCILVMLGVLCCTGQAWVGMEMLTSRPCLLFLFSLTQVHRTHWFGSLEKSGEKYLPFPKLLYCSVFFLTSFLLLWQQWGDSETTRQEIKCWHI